MSLSFFIIRGVFPDEEEEKKEGRKKTALSFSLVREWFSLWNKNIHHHHHRLGFVIDTYPIRKPALFSRVRTPKHTRQRNTHVFICCSIRAKVRVPRGAGQDRGQQKIAQRSSRRVASYASRPRRNRSETWRKATWKVTIIMSLLRFYSSFSRGGYRMSLDFRERAGARRRGRPRRSCAQMH